MGLQEFFDLVVDGRVELRAIKDKGKALGRLFGGDLERFVQQFNGKANLYFGVLPRPIPDFSRVAWADIDFKMSDEKTARERLAAFNPAPHVIVATGGGLHVYWLLDPPLSTIQLKPFLKALAAKIGGDPVSTDPARILRVPDTLNVKYDPPRPCTIEYVDPAADLLRYSPGEFGLIDAMEVALDAEAAPSEHGDFRERSEAAFAKAIALAKEYPPAIQGSHGDDHTYQICARLVRDLGIKSGEAYEILSAHWNPRCNPPWNDAELREKIEHAKQYGKGQIGGDDPAAEFEKVAQEIANEIPEIDPLDDMDQKFHVVNDGGQVRIYADEHDIFGSYWHGYPVKDFIEVATDVWKYGMVRIKGRGIVPRARLWLETKRPNQKTYRTCVFDPSNRQESDVFNIYRGLTLEPVEGDWSMLEELIYDILSSKDQKVSNYILDWCAMAVQRPWEKPRTTLIFRGIEGTGKTIFGETFMELFGRYGIKIDSPEQLTGRFNEHLREKIGVFVDEAFWSRDHKQEGVIKGLVTDRFKQYEGKFKPLLFGWSYAHIIMGSNNEHVARIVGADSRRYVVMNVETKKSPVWYKALVDNREQIKRAWLHALLARDISAFDPAVERPITEAYFEQMTLSRDPIVSWLRRFVENNYEDDLSLPVRPGIFRVADIRESIIAFMKATGERIYERGDDTYIGIRLHKLLPTLRKARLLATGKQTACYIFPLIEHAKERLGIKDVPDYDESEELI